MVLVCIHLIMASTVAACQSLKIPLSSNNSSLFSSTNVSNKSSLKKRRVAVRKCGRLSFNTYASASENKFHAHIADVPTLYDILELDQHVGLHEIKSAFRQLARQHHPDVCSSADTAEATTRFIKVKEAYDTLSDPDLKAEYDEYLTNPLSWPKFAFVKANKERSTWQTASPHQNRAQWEDQLSGLRQKAHRSRVDGPMQEARNLSWGSRMRQTMKENSSVYYSED
ncbi:hypothetical protein O6H91_14G017800 [Diphasiastrum complanatum]|uniref:Uncharacterized protein n=1 Tax=Diphasiastrum complanatum TaxID=34168 RepID=A0ACC2BLV3_DIPCM|nr:hypothetical protein O6H91_14G017800 [Diphasiastrum complanatum]